MNATLELIEDCGRSGVKMSVRGQNLRVDAPQGLPDSMKEALRHHKADIIRALTRKTELEIKVRNPHLDTPTLTMRLSQMIAAGVKFEISADDFQTFSASERETTYLQANKKAVLCTLQQSFLQKHLFRHSKELLEVFTVEVHERSAMMTDGAPGTSFEAVCEVAKEWTAEQIEKL